MSDIQPVGHWLEAFSKSSRRPFKFLQVRAFYAKPIVEAGSELKHISCEFVLHKAFARQTQPPVIIVDSEGAITRTNSACYLTSLTKEEIEALMAKLPKKIKEGIQEIVELYGPGANHVYFKALPALRNLDFLQDINWKDLVAQIVNFKDTKLDPNLKLCRQVTLLRGFDQATNAHGIICLPAMTGKSDWFDLARIKSERVKSISLVGYSDTDGQHPGTLDGTELPYCIDQFESQGEWQIFRNLLSLLESGEAQIDTGAQPFTLKSVSPIILLSNPESGDSAKSFKILVDHMAKVPALGRRFAFILYDKDAVRIEDREHDLETWSKLFELFRAVEEFTKPRIRKLLDQKETWKWLNQKSPEWITSAKSIIDPFQETNPEIHAFLSEYVSHNASHVRGAALRAAIAENLDKIALEMVGKEGLFASAEEIYSELQKMNQESLRNIVQNYKEEVGLATKVFFDTAPGYLKDAILAVELFKSYSKDKPAEIAIESIDYKPQNQGGMYLSQVVHLALRGNPEKWNSALKEHCHFELKRVDKQLVAVILDYSPVGHLRQFVHASAGKTHEEKQTGANEDRAQNEGNSSQKDVQIVPNVQKQEQLP